MHGSTGGSWTRSTLVTATEVGQPVGKPQEHQGFGTYRPTLPPTQLPTLPSILVGSTDG
jgi:hypothetical protein